MTYDPNQPPQQNQPYPPTGYPPTGYPAGGALDYQTMGPTKPTSTTVIGVIGIIFGSLGIICGPFALLPYVLPKFMPNQATQPNPAVDIINDSPLLFTWTIASTIISIGLAAMLLAGAIGSLKLSRWARKLLINYALISLVMIVIGFLMVCIAFVPPLMSGGAKTPELIGGLIGGLFGMLFGAALPVAILICYRRPNVIEAFERGPR